MWLLGPSEKGPGVKADMPYAEGRLICWGWGLGTGHCHGLHD